MSVAIRAITRLQDSDDVNVSLGVGVDEYALVYDHDTGKFVLRAPAAAPDLSGYALLAGRAGGQTLYGGTAANDDITIHGTSDATRTTSYVLLQPSGGNVGIGTSAPGYTFEIAVSGDTGAFRTEVAATSYGANWVQSRARGTIVSKTVVQDGDILGGMIAQGYDGSAYRNAGRIVLYIDGTPGASDMPGRIEFRTTPDGTATEQTRMVIKNSGFVGIGTTAPATLLHGLLTSAATNAVTNVLTIGHDTTGTASAGFGAGVLFQLESSTTAAQSAARVQALWYGATHATRKADLVATAYDAAGEREIWRGRANGSAPALGVLGATPIARIAHVADPAGGATVDAEARSAINSILASLEGFGFHATS